IQAILLFVVIIVGSKMIHPGEFDQATFLSRLEERENPLILDDSASGDSADFIPIEGDNEDLDMPPEEPEVKSPPEKPKKTVPMVGLLASVANVF
ncbi:MAG: hypothetical protein HC845_03430, partial [Akkermansiaceae bacterium]|nr:hypothetical protein [Akkermansiaceae bacterium]